MADTDLGHGPIRSALSYEAVTGGRLIMLHGRRAECGGARPAPFAAMLMASLQGDGAKAAPLIETTIAEAAASGQGIAATYAHWAAAILNNGLGRYAEALAAAQYASQETRALYFSAWALPELVEAASALRQ